MNVANHLVRAGAARGERPAVARGGVVLLRYAALADRAARIAGALRRTFGLNPGDRVGLAMKNCPEFLEVMYGCWHAGLVAVPINAKLHKSEFAFILENSGAKACFTTADLSETIASLQGDALERVIEVGGDEYQGVLQADAIPCTGRAPQDPAWLFYTSGTTGRPKGAELSHRNLLAAIFCYFADMDQGAPWDAMLHAAPMSHGSGLYGLAHVTQASCHVLPESGSFVPAEIYEIIGQWPGLVFFAAPTMVKRLLDHSEDVDTSNLKQIQYGGGPMYVADSRAALERFGPKLAQLYGQGESPMTITALSAQVHADSAHPRWLERLGSVGIAQSVVEVRVADADDNFLPAGESGEILVRGDSVMNGYWGNPEATAETLRGGWLHTGDVGTFDADGFLTLMDRSKDMIISGGTNIYPREVEEVLLRHPEIAEVSVIGRPHPEWGEVVIAYIVAGDRAPEPALLDTYCAENIARFKRPKEYRFVDELPKNNYGKVLKTELRDIDAKAINEAGKDA
ncbi:MAG: AMP-binding protein [Alphaproteobacteria bacterium]|nr:AMP-binding protein [Alphaproteobacteria bacterium]